MSPDKVLKTKTPKMNTEPKFEILVITVLFVFYEKIDPIIQSPFGTGAKRGGFFFFLDNSSKQVKCRALQVAKKNENRNFLRSKNRRAFLTCWAVNALAIALIKCMKKSTEI